MRSSLRWVKESRLDEISHTISTETSSTSDVVPTDNVTSLRRPSSMALRYVKEAEDSYASTSDPALPVTGSFIQMALRTSSSAKSSSLRWVKQREEKNQ